MLNFNKIFPHSRLKQLFCFFIVFLFLFSPNYQSTERLFFLEKLSESEKEENKNEEEQIEETQESAFATTYKAKKSKKFDFDNSDTFPITSFKILFATFHNSYTTFSFRFPFLFVHSPRYVVFGSLLFYEA